MRATSACARPGAKPRQGQNLSEVGEDLPRVVPVGAEERVLRASEHAVQPVPTQLGVEPLMANLGIDERTSLHLLLDGHADPLLPPGDDHLAGL